MARWTSEQELDAARAMRHAEAEALSLIEDIDLAVPILSERSKRSERTNAAAIDRLERAVSVVFKAHRRSSNRPLRDRTRQAARLMAIAADWRWKLAMSARYVANAESFKRSMCEQDQAELAQVGCIGLMDAAKRFDPARELRFTTYARWWVVARMTRHLNPYPVKVSPNFLEKRGKVHKAMRKLEKKGIDWDIEELAFHAGLTANQTKKVLEHPLLGVSLSTPIHDSPEGRQRLLIDDLADDNVTDPAESLHRSRMQKWLSRSLSRLNRRQRFVLTRRYGLDDGQWRTLSEVGRELSLSRERVRQIESEALLILRGFDPPGIESPDPDPPNPPSSGRPKILRTSPISEDRLLEKLQEDAPVSKALLTEQLCSSDAPSDKRRVLGALKRLERKGLVRRHGKGLTTRWSKVTLLELPPNRTAPWKSRIEFDLSDNPWSTSGEIADRLDERERLNSLSATLGILHQSGHLVRKGAGKAYQYALPSQGSSAAAAA